MGKIKSRHPNFSSVIYFTYKEGFSLYRASSPLWLIHSKGASDNARPEQVIQTFPHTNKSLLQCFMLMVTHSLTEKKLPIDSIQGLKFGKLLIHWSVTLLGAHSDSAVSGKKMSYASQILPDGYTPK